MTKISINLKLDEIKDANALNKINTLKRNERLTDFIKMALNDEKLLSTFNDKIAKNELYATLQTDNEYNSQIREEVNKLQSLLQDIRFNLHSALSIAKDSVEKENSIQSLSALDSILAAFQNKVMQYRGEYVDSLKWLERERELQKRFEELLKELQPIDNTKTNELLDELKNMIQFGAVITQVAQTNNAAPAVQEQHKEDIIEVEKPQYEEVKEEFEGDLDALSGFFGMG